MVEAKGTTLRMRRVYRFFAARPQRPEDILSPFLKDVEKIYGENLGSVILYGSGASGEYLPGRSNLNFLVVLKKMDFTSLKNGLKLARRWGRKGVVAPLFLTEREIRSSLDVFPIEFLEIQENYTVVYGEDPFKNLRINKKNLRLECERELKGKLLRLRQAFLETGLSRKGLELLISNSLNSIFPLFRSLLRMRKIKPPIKKGEIVDLMADTYSLKRDVFLKLLQVKAGILNLKTPELHDLYEEYLKEVESLVTVADKLRV